MQAYRSGNVSLSELLRGLAYSFYFYGTRAGSERSEAVPMAVRPLPDDLGRVSISQKDRVNPRRTADAEGRSEFAARRGRAVKPYADILATLDQASSNRGLKFDAEFVPVLRQDVSSSSGK